jgi:hypothetical protein
MPKYKEIMTKIKEILSNELSNKIVLDKDAANFFHQ